jgi:hypothetical protein
MLNEDSYLHRVLEPPVARLSAMEGTAKDPNETPGKRVSKNIGLRHERGRSHRRRQPHDYTGQLTVLGCQTSVLIPTMFSRVGGWDCEVGVGALRPCT